MAPLNREAVVASTVRRVCRYFPRADPDDLVQTAWVWMLEHPDQVDLHPDQPRLSAWKLGRALMSHLYEMCAREKAESEGYSRRDEFHYGEAMVYLILPAVLSGDSSPPPRLTDEGARSCDGSEGGTWMAHLADMQQAWQKAELTPSQRAIVADVIGDGRSQVEVADELGVSQQAVSRRLSGAIERIIEQLGGFQPRDLDEEWLDRRLRERPRSRR